MSKFCKLIKFQNENNSKRTYLKFLIFVLQPSFFIDFILNISNCFICCTFQFLDHNLNVHHSYQWSCFLDQAEPAPIAKLQELTEVSLNDLDQLPKQFAEKIRIQISHFFNNFLVFRRNYNFIKYHQSHFCDICHV